MTEAVRKGFSMEQALAVADEIGLDLASAPFDAELEHGRRDPVTDVTRDDPIITGKIAWAHLREMPDYYLRLDEMEREAEGR